MSVITEIYDSMRMQGREITPQEVDKILVYYLNNAPTVIPHFTSHAPNETVSKIAEGTGIHKTKVLQTMLTVETLAQDGEIRTAILFPDAKGSVEETVEYLQDKTGDVVTSVRDSTEGILKQVKWIGIIGLVGVGLYFGWPYLKKMRSK